MKKICLFICIILLSGCYNFNEIEDLAIISAVAIDYTNYEYQIIFEIEEIDQDGSETPYLIDGKGTTITKAFNNTASNINKTLYFANLEILLLTSNISDPGDIINYISDNYDFAFNFSLALSDQPYEVIKEIHEQNHIFGPYVKKLLERKAFKKYNVTYPEFLQKYLADNNFNIPLLELENNNLSFRKAG